MSDDTRRSDEDPEDLPPQTDDDVDAGANVDDDDAYQDVEDVEDLESDEIDSGIEVDSEADDYVLDVVDLDAEEPDIDDLTGAPDEEPIEQVQEPYEPEPDSDDAGNVDVDAEAHVQAVSWYQNRWRDIQIDFVDMPRDAVANADRLVADVIEQLTTALAEERNKLAAQWSQDEVSTEDLRVAFQGYRAFFERLVAT